MDKKPVPTIKVKRDPVNWLLNVKLPAIFEAGDKELADFNRRITNGGTAYALEWGEDLFLAAARQQIAREVHSALTCENPSTLQKVADVLHERVISGARWGRKSTSTCNNLINQYKLQAITEMWEAVDNLIHE